MLEFERFEALSFDCYGTLIDWESGILAALRPILARHGIRCDDDRLLAIYGRAEADAEAGPYVPYREILRRVLARLAGELGFALAAGESDALAESLASWPPFPDTVAALRALKTRYRLAIASNIDDDLFAATNRLLGVEFNLITTAAQVRSYKPAPGHFIRTLEGLGVGSRQLLHVAQSRFHDIVPARALGIATVWVNRRAGKAAGGATPDPSGVAVPDEIVPDLRTLVERIGIA